MAHRRKGRLGTWNFHPSTIRNRHLNEEGIRNLPKLTHTYNIQASSPLETRCIRKPSITTLREECRTAGRSESMGRNPGGGKTGEKEKRKKRIEDMQKEKTGGLASFNGVVNCPSLYFSVPFTAAAADSCLFLVCFCCLRQNKPDRSTDSEPSLVRSVPYLDRRSSAQLSFQSARSCFLLLLLPALLVISLKVVKKIKFIPSRWPLHSQSTGAASPSFPFITPTS